MVIYKKKEKNVTDDDPDEYGDFYSLRDCRKSTLKAPKLKIPEILLKLNQHAAPCQV